VSLPTLYKGAGPGTHWHINDACVQGFVCARRRPPTANAVVTHITNYSHPSPYLSFSTSYAVARQYALSGPGGIASAANPGYVYEVDLAACTGGHSTFNAVIFNPVQELANLGISHEHNGDQALIVGVASGSPHDPVFAASIPQAGGGMTLPTVTKELRALVYSLRDAEVLITRVPPACVVIRHNVY
jgi:hypothetical protein